MKKLAILSGAIFSVAIVNAGQITVANNDIKIDGALTTGYFTSNNTGSSNHDSFKVSNFILGLSSDAKDGGIGFNVGFGTVLLPTVYDGGLVDNKAIINKSFGPIYAVLSYKPISSLTLDVGLLTTNIGYELATSFTNPNITYGAVWSAQSFIYPGARITYALGDIKFYAEASKDKGYSNGSTSLQTSGAYAVGSLGTLYGVNYAISYYDYTAYKNLIDIIFSKSINDNLDVGINFDYQWLDNTVKRSEHDSKGYGVAGYIIPKIGNFSLPVRIEYVDGGSKGKESGIYGFIDNSNNQVNISKAWTVTTTPTFRPTKNTYIRAEVSYVNSNEKIFKNSSGNPKDTKVSAAAEFGFLF